MKKCTVCKLPKPYAEFHKARKGYRSNCKECRKLERHKEYSSAAKYRLADPIRNKAKIFTRFWPGSDWQAAWSNYNDLLVAQNYKCGICKNIETAKDNNGKVKELAVDHCHITGAVRGILCDRCNRGIGFLKDSAQLCATAFLYLSKAEIDFARRLNGSEDT